MPLTFKVQTITYIHAGTGNIALIRDSIYKHQVGPDMNDFYYVVCADTNQIVPMAQAPCGFEPDYDQHGILGQLHIPTRQQLQLALFALCGCSPLSTSYKHPADLTPHIN